MSHATADGQPVLLGRAGGVTAVAERDAGPSWSVGYYERTAQMLLPAARALVEAVAPVAAQRLLDLGAGTGNAALLAAEAGACVTAVDPALRLLAVAADDARRRGLPLGCAVGEASHLPTADHSFDCVLSSFGVIFAPDAEVAVAEMVRVLRPGGRAAVTAWLPGGALGALAAAVQELVRTATGAPPPPPRFPWHQEAVVIELFDRHGMRPAAAEQHELVFTATSPRAYLDAELRSHPLAVTAFEALRRAGQGEAAREHLLQVLNEHNEDPRGFRSTSQYLVFVFRHVV